VSANTVTLGRIQREIRKMDPALNESDGVFKSATILLSALQVGTSVRALSKFTGLPAALVKERVVRLRASNVFRRDGKIRAGWFDKDGAMDFWLDCLVAEGMMQRGSQPAAKAAKG
jgi:hypothetical protein